MLKEVRRETSEPEPEKEGCGAPTEGFKVSERRASCRVADQPRSSQRYISTKAGIDTALMQRMVALSKENPPYGYRRVCALLRREGGEQEACPEAMEGSGSEGSS